MNFFFDLLLWTCLVFRFAIFMDGVKFKAQEGAE